MQNKLPLEQGNIKGPKYTHMSHAIYVSFRRLKFINWDKMFFLAFLCILYGNINVDKMNKIGQCTIRDFFLDLAASVCS
jgi:hypothetical protein